MKNFKLLLLSFYLILALSTCRKKCNEPCQDAANPTCDNYNPCLTKMPVKANFEMGALIPHDFLIPDETQLYVADSIFKGGRIYFKALEADASYTWFLGSEIINEKEFVRNFGDKNFGTFTVTLIVHKIPNSACFPNDDGKDTITKTFYIKPAYQLPVIGNYKVLFEGETDSSIVKIKPWNWPSPNPGWAINDTMTKEALTLINFKNTDDTIKWNFLSGSAVITGNNMLFNGIGNIHNENNTLTSGYLHILGGSKIETSYIHQYKKWKFKGRKL